uniref:Uncharacterized protein n=1 Tax=Anguilla anguilla TaxID=7936 RepID=A0A0E9XV81_ANGAN
MSFLTCFHPFKNVCFQFHIYYKHCCELPKLVCLK